MRLNQKQVREAKDIGRAILGAHGALPLAHVDVVGDAVRCSSPSCSVVIERGFDGWRLPGVRGLTIGRRGTTYQVGDMPLAIDASCAGLAGKILAMRIARKLAMGWATILAFIGNNQVVFANGKLAARVVD